MSLTVKGLPQLQKKLSGMKDDIHFALATALNTSINVVTAAAKNKVPIGATRNLSRSISGDVNERLLRGVVGLRWPGSQYGIYVEKGTKPHWPPAEPLRRWASQRGIPVFLVQRSIARKGTKAQPFMEPAYTRNRSFIKRQFTNALERAVKGR